MKKKLFLLFAAAIWLFVCKAEGDGSANSPYLISNASELDDVRNKVIPDMLKESACFRLTADIDLTDWLDNHPDPDIRQNGWLPIPSSYNMTFNGGGHTIKGLRINRPDTNGGLFAYVSGWSSLTSITFTSVIDSLNIVDCDIVGSYSGAIVGSACCIIQHCSVSGKIKGDVYAGGIAGTLSTDDRYHGTSRLLDCHFAGTVQGSGRSGGIAGRFVGGEVSQCSANAIVQSDERAGGLFGSLFTSSNTYTSSESQMSNCIVFGEVHGISCAGGLVGEVAGYDASFTISGNVAALTKISATGGTVNRLFGTVDSDITLTASNNHGLASTLVNGKTVTGTATGMQGANATLASLQTRSFYETLGWDMAEFEIREGKTFPYPKFFSAPPTLTTAPVSRMTALSGACENGVTTVYATVGNETLSSAVSGNTWNITLPQPLAAYDIVWVKTTDSSGKPAYPALRLTDFKGEGTSENPYLVHTMDELTQIMQYPEAAYRLENDLDAATWQANHSDPDIRQNGWKPLATSSINKFKGQLDGAGHSIENLYMKKPANNNTFASAALIYYAEAARIANLNITNCDITGNQVAGIINYGTGVTIENCHVSGSIKSTDSSAAGIGCNLSNNSTVTGCSFTGTIDGRGAGICSSLSGSISDCFVWANITGSGVAGIVYNAASGCSVSRCHVSGILRGSGYAYGIGYLYGSTANDCYVSALISGGTAGIGSHANKCYIQGEMLGNDNVYGIGEYASFCVSALSSILSINKSAYRIYSGNASDNNYALATMLVNGQTVTSSNPKNNQGADTDLATLQTSAFYSDVTGWDMTDTWTIWENNSLPYFPAQAAPPALTAEPTLGETSISGKYKTGENLTVWVRRNSEQPQQATLGDGNWSLTFSRPLTPGDQISVWSSATGKLNSYIQFRMIKFAEGDGTEASPYLVRTADDLAAMNCFPSAHFRLMNDIVLTDWISENHDTDISIHGWLPIGTEANPFSGTFKGNNYKITGLTINRPETDCVGLFGVLTGTLDSLYVEGDVIGNNYTGLVAGKRPLLEYTKRMEQIGGRGNITGQNNTGGLFGCIIRTSSGSFGGGCIGYPDYSGFTFKGKVNGNDNVGGIAGTVNGGMEAILTFSNSFASAVVSGKQNVGGISGAIYTSGSQEITEYFSDITVTNTYTTGAVSGDTHVGGLVGLCKNGWTLKISNSWSSMTVDCSNTHAGGIAGTAGRDASGRGDNSAINYSAALNNSVLGSNYTGRIAGAEGTLSNNYALENMLINGETVSGSASSIHGQDKSLATLRQQAAYTSLNWDFDNTWNIWADNSFPYFHNQSAPINIENEPLRGEQQLSGRSQANTTVYVQLNDETPITTSGSEWSVNLSRPLAYDDILRMWTSAQNQAESYDWIIQMESDKTGIESVENHKIAVYPNPAKDDIIIESGTLKIESVAIYDLTGKMVNRTLLNGKSIPVSHLPKGIYLLKIHTDKGIAVSKIVKE